jgi:hypothetical protein
LARAEEVLREVVRGGSTKLGRRLSVQRFTETDEEIRLRHDVVEVPPPGPSEIYASSAATWFAASAAMFSWGQIGDEALTGQIAPGS